MREFLIILACGLLVGFLTGNPLLAFIAVVAVFTVAKLLDARRRRINKRQVDAM